MTNIHWDNVVNNLKNGEVRTIGVDFYQNKHGEFNEIIQLWESADYTGNKVEWINFYPVTHFDKDIETEFGKLVNLTPVRSWISCVRPGKNAPWHRDIDDNMNSYESLGTLERYTCFIQEPKHGQVMLLEDRAYYMEPKYKIVKWTDILAWHGASNCGFTNHYLYHFLGYK